MKKIKIPEDHIPSGEASCGNVRKLKRAEKETLQKHLRKSDGEPVLPCLAHIPDTFDGLVRELSRGADTMFCSVDNFHTASSNLSENPLLPASPSRREPHDISSKNSSQVRNPKWKQKQVHPLQKLRHAILQMNRNLSPGGDISAYCFCQACIEFRNDYARKMKDILGSVSRPRRGRNERKVTSSECLPNKPN